MGNNNVYNNQSIQYHHHFNQKNNNNNSIFLPIFCKLSLKDINLNNTNQSRNRIKATDEPSSPKVSCMGQVKRNNRVTTFPITATPIHQHHQQKYSRLKKLFSSKSLLPPAPNPASVRSKSCRASKDRRDMRRLRSKIGDDDRSEYVKVEVDIREMDPPLPVVKKAARDEVNIWKRRGMQGLQIDQIPLPNCRFHQAPPTV